MFAFDAATLESIPLVRSFVRTGLALLLVDSYYLGFLMFLQSFAQLGLPLFVSDVGHCGFSPLLHSSGHVGFALLAFGIAWSDLLVLVFDVALMASLLPLQSSACLGLPPSVSDHSSVESSMIRH